MKKVLLLLVLLCASIGFATPASAKKGVIFYSDGETLKTLEKLPADCVIDGQHVNFGMRYESFAIFWMPVWNYGEYKYALVNDAEDTWAELTLEEAKALGKEYKFEVPDQPTLPLISQIGLKPVIVLLVLFLIYGAIPSGKKKEQEGEVTEEKTEEAS